MTEPLHVSELFYSIQGESTWAGLPCLFVRLAGCNLRCAYCDARYAWQEPGKSMTVEDILAWAAPTPGVPVEITGGEPLLQTAAYPLMQALVREGREVLLETNGSLALDRVPEAVRIIMDIKCPGSGMAGHNLPENLAILRDRRERGCRDEIKFVLSSEGDFHWARELLARTGLAAMHPVLFSPVRPLFAPQALAELLLAYRLPVRLQLQLHTQLWPEKTRGA
ncbi:MAG: radical SAM protein [Desulfobulbus sp.]|uniref:radical SAM protein n=1 Tax=Desulfobulbus sp. TaxID=895 RepID=UPI0028453FC7|nr:radical SAM protein [Desulfobulbus sp.]MDR2550528.1 radical SAM protein [Desulfobulbus sp.]